MKYQVSEPDGQKREDEKQASRDEDARGLAAGEISEEELRRRNSFFRSLTISNFKMVAIGGKPVSRRSMK
jgi:hypothetical protein